MVTSLIRTFYANYEPGSVSELPLAKQEQAQLQSSRTVNAQAYELYLRGLTYSREYEDQSKLTAVHYFNRAIQIDPAWAAPYAQIAGAYGWIAGDGDTKFYRKSKDAALKAIQIDGSVSEAHEALAFVLHNYDWDWTAAEREYKRALAPEPSNSGAHAGYGLLLMAEGRGKTPPDKCGRQ